MSESMTSNSTFTLPTLLHFKFPILSCKLKSVLLLLNKITKLQFERKLIHCYGPMKSYRYVEKLFLHLKINHKTSTLSIFKQKKTLSDKLKYFCNYFYFN